MGKAGAGQHHHQKELDLLLGGLVFLANGSTWSESSPVVYQTHKVLLWGGISFSSLYSSINASRSLDEPCLEML